MTEATAGTTSDSSPSSDTRSGGEPSLKRVMGPWLLLLFIVGDILGTGIYALTGQVAKQVGGVVWLPFLSAFAVALITAFSYLELVTKYPRAAGAALYAHRAFRVHFITFIVAFAVMCSGITSASTASRAFAANLSDAFQLNLQTGIGITLVGLAFMAAIAAINFRGVGESLAANVILTCVELTGLLIIIVIGLWAIGLGQGDVARAFEFKTTTNSHWVWPVVAATTLAFFAMVGFEDSVNMAEETKDPVGIFPKILLTGLLITAAIYVLVSISAITLVDPAELAEGETPLLKVVAAGAPNFPIWIFGFITMFAVANTALINMLMASRLIYGMAKQNVLPPVLGKVLPGRRSPYVAIGFTTLLAFALIVYVRLGSESTIVGSLSGTTSLLLLAVFTIVNIACLILRRDPARPGGFRAPVVVPVLGAVLCAYLLGPWARLEADLIQYRIAAGLLGLGIVLWAVTRIVHKPEGGHFEDIEHMDVDPTDD